MTMAILLGMGAGFGILTLATALRPRRQLLSTTLQTLDRDPVGEVASKARGAYLHGTGLRGIRSRTRQWLAVKAIAAIDLVPGIGDKLRRDLESAAWSTDVLVERCALSGVAGALLPFLVWALLSMRGISMQLALPIWVGLIGASAGAAMPILVMRAQARSGRRQARRMVGCFLDLVVLALAGGLGIEGALHAAAAIGDTKVSHQLVRSLEEARDAGRTPWDALERLGHELAVPELVELSFAVSLAGTEGARIRSTLASKAASIRRHELADAEAEANTITERLFIPGVLLLIGFVIFIGYPAVARLTAGL